MHTANTDAFIVMFMLSLSSQEEELIPGDDNEDELHHHHQQQQQRLEQSCSSDEMLWQFKLQTDNAGSETTWKLEQKTSSGAYVKVLSGPTGGFKYGANTTYKSSACLKGVNMYQLTVLDAGGDGICCGKGKGSFQYAVGGVTEYTTGQTKKTFTTEAVRSFYVGLPPPAPISGRSSSCADGEQQIGIRIKTDKYGSDNAWELRSLTSGKLLHSVAAGTYADGASRTDSYDVCVPNGSYRFTLMDAMGDGICCENGIGRYMLYINGEVIVHGSDYTVGKKVQHTIVVGYDDTVLANQMSTREIQYLNGHNWRRKMYHEQFGSTYVPLKYDLSLAEDAQYWANQLLTDCDVQGIDHMPGQEQGENLAKNVGFDYESGQLYPVENICRRWFEREETWPFPNNAHFTQGLWRSSKYMGCAESSKIMEDGRTCRIQVCRYARAGNCNMGHFDATVGDNWKIPMLDDDNQCGPICPPNGCH